MAEQLWRSTARHNNMTLLQVNNIPIANGGAAVKIYSMT